MIVEDDNASRTAMRYLLAHHGWQTSDAANLSAGAELLQSFAPHILVLDLMLPDGDGVELLRRIRAQSLPIHVAVITGIGDQDALDQVKQLKPDILFRKPINVHAFLQWLDAEMV